MGGQSPLLVWLQKSVQKALARLGQLASLLRGKRHPSALTARHFGQVAVVERHGGEQHDEEDAPQPPHVVGFGVVQNSSYDLRGRVGRAAAEGLAQHVLLELPRKAEVADDNVPVLFDEDVLGFDVSVDYSVAVEMVHSQHYLPEYPFGLPLTHGAFALDQVQEVALGGVFHYNEHPLVEMDDLFHARDVLVTHFGHDVQLSGQKCLDVVLFGQFFVDDFRS